MLRIVYLFSETKPNKSKHRTSTTENVRHGVYGHDMRRRHPKRNRNLDEKKEKMHVFGRKRTIEQDVLLSPVWTAIVWLDELSVPCPVVARSWSRVTLDRDHQYT